MERKKAKKFIKKIALQFGPESRDFKLGEAIQIISNPEIKRTILSNINKYEKLFEKLRCSKNGSEKKPKKAHLSKKYFLKDGDLKKESILSSHSKKKARKSEKYEVLSTKPKMLYNLYKSKHNGLDSLSDKKSVYGHLLPLLLRVQSKEEICQQFFQKGEEKLVFSDLLKYTSMTDVPDQKLMDIFLELIDHFNSAEIKHLLTCITMKSLPTAEGKYFDLMAAILAAYIDQLLLESRSVVNHHKLGKKLLGFVSYTLREMPTKIFDALAQAEEICQEDAMILLPIFRWAFHLLTTTDVLTPDLYAKACIVINTVMRCTTKDAEECVAIFDRLSVPTNFESWLDAHKIRSSFRPDAYKSGEFILSLMEALIEEGVEEEGLPSKEENDRVTSETEVKQPDQLFFIDTGADKSVQEMFPAMEEIEPESDVADEEEEEEGDVESGDVIEDPEDETHCGAVVTETLKTIRALTEKKQIEENYKQMRPTSADFFEENGVDSASERNSKDTELEVQSSESVSRVKDESRKDYAGREESDKEDDCDIVNKSDIDSLRIVESGKRGKGRARESNDAKTSPQKSPRKSKAPGETKNAPERNVTLELPKRQGDAQPSPKKNTHASLREDSSKISPKKTRQSEKLQQKRLQEMQLTPRMRTRSDIGEGVGAKPPASPATPRRRTRSESVHENTPIPHCSPRSPMTEVDIVNDCEISRNKLKLRFLKDNVVIEEVEEEEIFNLKDAEDDDDDDEEEQHVDPPVSDPLRKKASPKKEAKCKTGGLYDFHSTSSEEEMDTSVAGKVRKTKVKSGISTPKSLTKKKPKTPGSVSSKALKFEEDSRASPAKVKKTPGKMQSATPSVSGSSARSRVRSRDLTVDVGETNEDTLGTPTKASKVTGKSRKSLGSFSGTAQDEVVLEEETAIPSTPKSKKSGPTLLLGTPKSARGANKELAALKQCAVTDFFQASPLSPEESCRRYSLRHKPADDQPQSSIFAKTSTDEDGRVFGTPRAAITYSAMKRRRSEIPKSGSDLQMSTPTKRRLSSIRMNPDTPTK